jgi:hypothetical protein
VSGCCPLVLYLRSWAVCGIVEFWQVEHSGLERFNLHRIYQVLFGALAGPRIHDLLLITLNVDW